MTLRNVWNEQQRRRLIAQLATTSRAFAGALPAEEAIDGLIINLHLCLTLELSPAEVQEVLGARVLSFLAAMLAAAHSENVRPQPAIDIHWPLPAGQPLVKTQIGVIDRSGKLRPAAPQETDQPRGTVHLIFRGRAKPPFA